MANIRVNVNYTVKDGSELVFRSPADCSAITGLIVYYPGENETTSKVFALADAHANNVGDIDNLFAENVVVKVILDVTAGMAYVQNADTNAYLEGRFAALEAGTTGTGATLTGWAVTEGTDGSVTLVNTLENGTETIEVTADANGNPASLSYNGVVIPGTWTEATETTEEATE